MKKAVIASIVTFVATYLFVMLQRITMYTAWCTMLSMALSMS